MGEEVILNLDDHYRIKKLETRVDALEGKGGDYGVTSADLVQLVHAVEGMRPYTVIRTEEYERLLSIEAERAKSDTFDGRCIVPEERVLRWERIERAAKEAVDRLEFAPPGSSAGVARFVLVEALKP